MDIQTIGFEMNHSLQQRLENLINKVKSFFPSVNWIDVYFKKTKGQTISPRKVRIRFAIPGPDISASDTGYSWKPLLKNVEKKLIRQLEKRKARMTQ
jgi:ribosome-associated translation inhibitor RaiA